MLHGLGILQALDKIVLSQEVGDVNVCFGLCILADGP